jgi:F0F1-type ATP synthase membrane subunit b/b'
MKLTSARRRFAFAAMHIIFAGALIALPVRASSSQETQPPQHEPTMRSEEHKTEEAPDPLQGPAAKILRWLNFGIVVVAIGYVVIKKGRPAFRAHANDISAGISSAAAAKAEADAQLRNAEAGFARLPQDSAAMRETATREFATESQHLREGTVREVTRIEMAAKAEVSAAQRAARLELREVAARLAAARAAEIVGQQITPAQRAALVQKFVDGLPTAQQSGGVN